MIAEQIDDGSGFAPETNYADTVTSSTIDGIVYQSSKLATTVSLRLLGRLVAAIGEQGLRVVVGPGTIGARISRSLASGDVRAFAALVQIAEAISRDPSLPHDLLAGTMCGGLRPTGRAGRLAGSDYDLHFKGELPHLVNVLEFVVRHNYAGFSLGSLSTGGSLSSPSSATSTDDSSG